VTNEPRHITYSVPAVMCQHCRMAIESAVGPLAGVQSVSVDLEGKTVDVRLADGGASPEEIRGAIEEEGYEVAATSVLEG
jgi:copper chaperone